jgi:hypothetical protein
VKPDARAFPQRGRDYGIRTLWLSLVQRDTRCKPRPPQPSQAILPISLLHPNQLSPAVAQLQKTRGGAIIRRVISNPRCRKYRLHFVNFESNPGSFRIAVLVPVDVPAGSSNHTNPSFFRTRRRNRAVCAGSPSSSDSVNQCGQYTLGSIRVFDCRLSLQRIALQSVWGVHRPTPCFVRFECQFTRMATRRLTLQSQNVKRLREHVVGSLIHTTHSSANDG